jgi:hypothetical protein
MTYQGLGGPKALSGAIRFQCTTNRANRAYHRYFRDNAISTSANTASLSERLQQLGQQLSLTGRLGLFAKPTFNTDDTIGTALDSQMDDEDGEVVTDLALLQELLVSCGAFDRLALALRRTLYHNEELQMANVRTWVLEGMQNTACDTNDTTSSTPEVGCMPHHLARFDVDWSIVDFMCSQYGTNFPNIGAVVTLTGSALYAQATTCAEYVKTTWPVAVRLSLSYWKPDSRGCERSSEPENRFQSRPNKVRGILRLLTRALLTHRSSLIVISMP